MLVRGRSRFRNRSWTVPPSELEQAAEGANGLGIEAGFGPGRSGGVQIAAGQCQPQEALALRQEPVEVVGELGRVDDPEQLQDNRRRT